MALQSSLRSSLLVQKLGQCGRARTCASSRPGKLPTFNEVQDLRQTQAKCSLLVQVASLKSSESLATYLEQYGTVNSLYHYTTYKKEFLFVEMSSREEAEAVIRCACHPLRDQVVPVSSPLLWFRSGGPLQSAAARRVLPPVVQEAVQTPAVLRQEIAQCPTLDEQLVRHHQLTRLTELGTRLRYFTCELLERALAGLFPSARVRPFGSSANGFGRHDCDVDLVLDLAPARSVQASDRLAFQTLAAKKDSRTQTQRYLNILADLLMSLMPGCLHVRRILMARVPIIKYTQSLTGVDCDLSMARNGMQMTELLYIWSQLDPRVVPLVRAVRHWAEKVNLTNFISGSGRFISNFGITLLVIYFLQTRPVPVLPSVNELTQRARPGDTTEVDGVSYSFLRDHNLVPSTANTETLSQLLAAFFALYAELDLNSHALSVVWAGRFGHPGDAPLHVQNPLDLELNVTKNVSREEVCRLGREAERAGRLLHEGRWWELLLGERLSQQATNPLLVRELFDEAAAGDDAADVAPRAENVKLASLLGSAAGAGVSRGRASGGPVPFSELRLTKDGESPAPDQAAAAAGEQQEAAAAAAREQQAAAAAVIARDLRAASRAMSLLDATPDKRRNSKKKKKKKAAGR